MEGWKAMAEAFTIFSKYSTDDDPGNTAVEHDVIYAGPDPKIMSEEDSKRLNQLGWISSDEYDCWQKFV